MAKASATSIYINMLQSRFADYRHDKFANCENYFEDRPDGGAVVFRYKYRDHNLVVPTRFCDADRQRVIYLLPKPKRHRHFGSMRSSQALAQSVFGTLKVLNELALLSNIEAEDGRPAFIQNANDANFKMEKEITTLGELKDHQTSVDIWFENKYRVAVECKFGEIEFGTCSRPRLKPDDQQYDRQYCDGTYTTQRGRSQLCSLTELGVLYWKYTDQLLGWNASSEHRPCPLKATYQLVRNILAACVRDDGVLDVDNGHALILYDERNPTMSDSGRGDLQWHETSRVLQCNGVLRRLSWQKLLAQLPSRAAIDALKGELSAKYGFA